MAIIFGGTGASSGALRTAVLAQDLIKVEIVLTSAVYLPCSKNEGYRYCNRQPFELYNADAEDEQSGGYVDAIDEL